MNDLLEFDLPTNFAQIIKVLGVGGGGSNAVNHMLKRGIKDVGFIVANTDNQALIKSPVKAKIQLGKTLTKGLGAGNEPEVGREAAIESIEEIKEIIGTETKMIFITAGMGGGTGTGGAPIIAEAAKEMGILTVGIVTIPFRYEGKKRINSAIEGIKEMEKHVDALLIINNEKIREIYGNLGISQALGMADEVLTIAAKGIAEIITVEGHVNVDFADVNTVMKESGIALMGTGMAEGENRAQLAINEALNSPLLENTNIKGAENILLNITSGTTEATLDEVGFINEFVQDAAGNNAKLIWGHNANDDLGGKIAVSVIATGFGSNDLPNLYPTLEDNKEETSSKKKKYINLEDNTTDSQKEKTSSNNYKIENSINEGIVVKKIGIKEPIESTKKIIIDDEFEDYDNGSEPDFEFIDANIETESHSETQNSNSDLLRNYINNTNDLENVPAFKRKGIKIKEHSYTNNQKFSRYTLSDNDGEISLNENNTYLHDKAD